jgi:hypothetical protein
VTAGKPRHEGDVLAVEGDAEDDGGLIGSDRGRCRISIGELAKFTPGYGDLSDDPRRASFKRLTLFSPGL